MDDGLSPWSLLGNPIPISAPFDNWLCLVASVAHYALRAKPGLLRDLTEGWCQAIYVNGSIAHVADDDFLLLVIALANTAALALKALPWATLAHNLEVQGRLKTNSVEMLRTGAAVQDFMGRRGHLFLAGACLTLVLSYSILSLVLI
jgi:hypothetical protein